MSFGKKTFIWKFYITNKGLFIIEQIQIIILKEFVIGVLHADNETILCIWPSGSKKKY